ncbi:MAG: hypothetical protein ACHQEM_04180 [Chitinophagales bacterium]
MKKNAWLFLLVLLFSTAGCAQGTNSKNKKTTRAGGQIIGGGCDGCEAIYECPLPFDQLSWIDTLPDFAKAGPKLVISGTIYLSDGKTPAPNVVLYVYHTDQTGHYTPGKDQIGPGRRHGYIRGWMRTNAKGEYKFYTLRPAAYPNARIPAHIHPIVIEPGKNEYYIDEYLFEGDPLLTNEERRRQEGRGGNGIIKLESKNGMLWGERNIILGKNIPNYIVVLPSGVNSGLSIGAYCPAFDALNLSGIDSGKKAYPVCKYGNSQGIMIWFNHNGLDRLRYFALRQEKEMSKRGEGQLQVLLIYMNPTWNLNDPAGLEIQKKKITQ